MALGSKSLHCVLLLLHLVMMIVALTVLVISALSLAELLDKRAFVEGRHEKARSSASETGDAEVWRPERLVAADPTAAAARDTEDDNEGSPQGTITGPAILLVAVSSATLLLSAFAFYATLKMNVHLLSLFIVLMALALATQLSSGIWALAVRSSGALSIRASLIHQLDEYEVGAVTTRGKSPKAQSPATSLWTHPWDALQWQMKCCGIEGPDDYFSRGAIPLSCCAPAAHDEGTDDVSAVTPPPNAAVGGGFSCRTIRHDGCLQVLDDYVQTRQLWVGLFAIAGTVVEVIPMMLTVMYSISIKRDLRKIYQ